MIYKRLPIGMYSSNCYILGDNGEGIIIDPGADSEIIMENVIKLGLIIKYIVITHAHVDHICKVEEVRKKTGAKVAVHQLDADGLTDSRYNGSALFGLNYTYNAADILLKDGDVLEAGGLNFEIIHTPGHSAGGICIKVGNSIFTGDTLFRNSIGRTDLGNGDQEELLNSIKEKIMIFPDEVDLFPGHGTASTIGYEREHNPYI